MRRQIALRIVFGIMALSLAAPAHAGITKVMGVTGGGSLYEFYVPDGLDGDVWNGDVVYFAHGYRDPLLPIGFYTAPYIEQMKNALLDLGYGFAQSSYRTNGWAVKEGVQQTHQLRGLFEEEFGVPSRSYIAGTSMGGLITVALAEKFPDQYDGAMPMCGAVAGPPITWGYVVDTRVLFDYYYPGVLPGDATHVPEGIDFFVEFAPAIMGAMLGDPGGALEIGGIAQIDFTYDNPNELFETILFRLYLHTIGWNDLIDTTRDHQWFDNSQVYYTGSTDDVALNAGVDRFEATQPGLELIEKTYAPSGRLRIPMLTLHTTRDPLVPIEHEDTYRSIVTGDGADEWLVQQHVVRFGHCAFAVEEQMSAFLDLVQWVEVGSRPAGGEVSLP